MRKPHPNQVALIADLPAHTAKGVSNVQARKLRQQLLAADQHIVVPDFITYVQTDDQLRECVAAIKDSPDISLDVETRGKTWMTGRCVGLNIYTPSNERAYFIPNRMQAAARNFSDEEIANAFKPSFTNERIGKVGQNFKYDMHFMRETWGIWIAGFNFDTMVAARILNENEPHDLEYLCQRYLKIPTAWKVNMKGAPFETWPIKIAARYAGFDAKYTYDLKTFQMGHLDRPQLARLKNLVCNIEVPNFNLAMHMERRGVGFDMEYYTDVLRPTLLTNIKTASEAVFQAVGYEFTLGNPELVAKALFDDLGYPRINGNHTDKPVLDALYYSGQCPVAKLVLDWRQWATLDNMFGKTLPNFVYNDRIHCEFNTLGTRTGRYSCDNPNLQQMPKRIGPLIRRVIIPSPGCVLLSQDYGQMELRMLAHLGKVINLIAAFESGLDIHMAVLCDVFNIAQEYYLAHEHDADMVALRTATKNINFGILYGMGPSSLAGRIRRAIEECVEYIRKWNARYPEVNRFKNRTAVSAFEKGYVETIMGRKRRLPEIRSSNNMLSSAAEREAFNAQIQGSVADMIKMTTIKHDCLINERRYKYELLLNMHDELLYEVPEDWLSKHQSTLSVLKDSMANIVTLDVPVVVNQEILSRWGDKKEQEFEDEEEDFTYETIGAS